jgi:hypothetical protein
MLSLYDCERRYVGNLTKDLALVNYQKSLKIAQKLKLDKQHAELFTSAVDSMGKFLPFLNQKALLKTGLDIGLSLA